MALDPNQNRTSLPLIHDHDGHIDDLITLSLLALHAPNLVLTTLAPADCLLQPSTLATEKLLSYLGTFSPFLLLILIFFFLGQSEKIQFGCSTDEGTTFCLFSLLFFIFFFSLLSCSFFLFFPNDSFFFLKND